MQADSFALMIYQKRCITADNGKLCEQQQEEFL